MIGQGHVVQTLLESVKSDKLVHAYLLTGPRGIGKTSTARLLAKAINCEEILAAKKDNKSTTGEPCNKCTACVDINDGRAIDVIEIDAASHTGVDDIRDLIEKARLMPTKLKKKVYIIDEVHMLSKSAFNALLKTLEEPPEHVVFILATTEIHKIPATILSRAQRFDFKRAGREELVENLKRVAKTEKIEIDDDSLDLIAVSASGAHRDALGLLEQVAAGANGKITISETRQILGLAENAEVEKFIGAIFNNIPEEGLKIAQELHNQGYDLAEFNRAVITTLRQVVLLKVAKTIQLDGTKEEIKRLTELAGQADEDRALFLLQIFIENGKLFKEVSIPVLPLELSVVKSTQYSGFSTQDSVLSAEKNLKSEIQDLKQDQNIAAVIPAKAGIQAAQSQPNFPSARSGQALDPGSRAAVRDDKNEGENEAATRKSDQEVDTPEILCPVPVMEMTKDIWQEIISETKKENATLAALLRDAKPDNLTDDTLTIGVKFKFHKERISESKHAQILSKIITNVIGKNCRVVCKIHDGKSKPIQAEKKEDMNKIAAEVFEIE